MARKEQVSKLQIESLKHHDTQKKSPPRRAARTLWMPTINNHSGFGRWAFIEIDDPWNAEKIMWSGLNL